VVIPALGFLIVSPFSPCGAARTDDPDHIASLGEHHSRQTSAAGVPEQDEPTLPFRMPWIFNDTTQWIAEDRSGLPERYPMLRAIAWALRWSHSKIMDVPPFGLRA
jgi:hypothetical protein